MLKMSRGLYTGGNFKQNTWKNRRKIEDLNYDLDLTNKRFGANLFFIKFYYEITDFTTTTFTFGKYGLIEKWLTFKNGSSFDFFFILFSINGVTTGERKMLIEYMFCFICSEKCITIILSRKKCGLFSSVFRKIIPNNTTPTFQEVGGVT